MKTILLMRHSIPEKSSKFVTDPGLSPIVYNMEELRKVLTYHITVDNTTHVEKGVRSVTVNGNQIQGNVLPLANAGEQVEVRVILGNYSNSTF